MHRIANTISATLCLAILSYTELIFTRDIISYHYKLAPCTNIAVEGVVMAETLQESHQGSTLQCAIKCNAETSCCYAIFQQSTLQCFLVSNTAYSISSNLSYTSEVSCLVVLKLFPKPKCQNYGTLLEHVCQCPSNWTGRLCEERNKDFCRSSRWRQVLEADHGMLTNSNLPLKFLLHAAISTTVYPLGYFKQGSGVLTLEANHFLAMDLTAENFQTPLQREIQFYSSSDNDLETYLVGLTGNVVSNTLQNPSFDLMILESIDNNRPFYQDGTGDSVEDLLEGLSQGYRLIQREFVRVSFDKHSGNAFCVFLRSNVGASSSALVYPPYYWIYKKSLKSGNKFVLRWRIASGDYMNSNEGTLTTRWELDRCWTRVKPTEGYCEFTNVLKEMVLEGRDVRLVMGGSISTDIAMVTLTTNDVIASIADYITPLEGEFPLDASTRIIFSLVSRSGVLSECEKAFQGSIVYNQTTQKYTGSVEWFVSTRTYSKVFTVNSNGHAVFGSRTSVYNAALKGHNIRACVELEETAVTWMCSGSSTLNVNKEDQQVLFQTPSVMRVDTHQNGTLAGIADTDCRHSVTLLSTKGWVKMAVYNLQKPFSENNLSVVGFKTISWFVEL